MEEAQPEHHLPEGVLASLATNRASFFEPVVVYRQVGSQQVRLQPLRRLVGHLQAVLQHTHREVRARHRCEPQAERLGHLLRVQFLHKDLERRHPRRGEVAILEDHPPTLLLAIRNRMGGLGALPLAQRHRLLLIVHAQLLRETDDLGHGVGPAGQHEDQRLVASAVAEGLLQVEGGRLEEVLPQLRGDDILEALHGAISADRE
mmetsp:Transcript_25002/g.71898  ORF Transcript_25002/g.71898 Transcript_25002/m.71898 type:complete len:204 (+) Transcript_25002:1449-2060(+)